MTSHIPDGGGEAARNLFRWERFRAAMVGFMAGAAFLRAVESGGEWWAIFGIVMAGIVVVILVPGYERGSI